MTKRGSEFAMYMNWPLMGMGLVLVAVAYGQIYWAKLRKRGAIARGLYGNPMHFDPNLYGVLFSKAIVDDVPEGEDII